MKTVTLAAFALMRYLSAIVCALMFIATSSTASVAAPAAAADNFRGNGWWWEGAARSGTGLFFEAQCDKAFLAYFVYDDAGKPIWYYASGDFVARSDGTFTFSEDLLVTRGGQPASSNTPATPTSTSVGRISITFTASGTATVQLPQRSATMQRFDFKGLTGAPSTRPESGWFWNAQQSGRGYAVEIQNGTMFFAMFHYNADGSPTWNTFTGTVGAAGTISGDFASVSGGQTLSSGYRAPSPATFQPGFSGSFSGARAGSLTFPGNPTPTAITRFDFGSNAGSCSGSGSGSASGITYTASSASASAGAALAQINSLGAQGFAWVSGYAQIVDPAVPSTAIYSFVYLKTLPQQSYSYEIEPYVNNPAAFLARINQRGSDGFYFRGLYAFDRVEPPNAPPIYAVFMRVNGSNARYSYELSQLLSGSFNLSAANERGARGFSFRSTIGFGDPGTPQSFQAFMLFDKSSTDASTYSYELAPNSANLTALLSDINARGQNRFAFRGTTTEGSIFERSSSYGVIDTQLSSVSLSASRSIGNVIAVANSFAERGYYYFGTVANTDGSAAADLFIKGAPAINPISGRPTPQ
jgi:hypothetical protein